MIRYKLMGMGDFKVRKKEGLREEMWLPGMMMVNIVETQVKL